MAKKQNLSPLMRVSPRFKRVMEEAATERVRNGVEKRTPTSAEMTRMWMNAESFEPSLIELKTKPRKENLK